jgi:translation initiation factor 2B subunit (eIF-2B alpha/beta/delta family)
VNANEVKGGSRFGRAIAEVIALTAEQQAAAGRDVFNAAIEATAGWGVQTKPSMTSVHRVARIARETLAASADRPSAEAAESIAAAMRAFIAASVEAMAALAAGGLPLFKPGQVVMTHSYSESLSVVLKAAASACSGLTIQLMESRPLRESRLLAWTLMDTSARLELYSDAGMAIAAAKADLCIVGADAIFVDGSFANKTGSLPAALACRHFGVPLHVAGELSKVYLGDPADVTMEMRPAAELAGDWDLAAEGRVRVVNQFFETVPAAFVASYVTDKGIIAPSGIAAAAR